MSSDLHDQAVRLAAFSWLDEQVQRLGDVLPHRLLLQGFSYQGHRVPLLSQQGIFKPRILDIPLSIRTSPDGPYDDAFAPDGLLRYRYRGTEAHHRNHRDNAGLREAMRLERPLVYLHGIVKGRYLAIWPVYVAGDDPANFTFTVAVDDARVMSTDVKDSLGEPAADARRRYVTTTVRQRLHQRTFRERVLAAYREQCALCRLRHAELLDAAHIVPDTDPEGEPTVRNGLAMCKLHHAAFDRQILGVRPDRVVEVRIDVLREIDGPMLRYGLQEMHGTRIHVPRREDLRPDPERLASRYEIFRRAS